MTEVKQTPPPIKPVEPPVQSEQSGGSKDFEIDLFIWATAARDAFGVSGKGMAVAVLDTGLRVNHVDFAGRVPTQYNATTDYNSDRNNASDENGHGTNVAGLIAANDLHLGIAPEATVLPVKVLANNGSGAWEWLEDGLRWVVENRANFNITAVCMSLGDSGNHTSDEHQWFSGGSIQQYIKTLHDHKVAVVIAAGNDYFTHNSQQGMGFPAIIRECVSVGAVYDGDVGNYHYGSGAITHSSTAGQITPFSQRLHASVAPNHFTDIFAPGAPATSSGILNDYGESTQRGTSQATPVTVGVILLMQEFYKYETGELPTVAQLTGWLREGGVPIYDGDDEHDNVEHTHLEFTRIDALSALNAVRRHLQQKEYQKKRAG
jgi:subtilisin family serine protease